MRDGKALHITSPPPSFHRRNSIVDCDPNRCFKTFIQTLPTHAGIAGDGVDGDSAALHLPLIRVPGEAVLRTELPRAELREAHGHTAPDGLEGGKYEFSQFSSLKC